MHEAGLAQEVRRLFISPPPLFRDFLSASGFHPWYHGTFTVTDSLSLVLDVTVSRLLFVVAFI